MPHIIVEYSRSLEPHIPGLLHTLHDTLAAQGVDKVRIKTRGIPLDHAVVGEKGVNGAMLHATLQILEGRDLPTKKKLADPLHAAMKNAITNIECSVTLEVRDMAKDTYYA